MLENPVGELESSRGKLENHQGVSEPRGREDCGAGKLLYHLRGYSELLGTILVGENIENPLIFLCFLRPSFGTKI